MWEKKFTPGPWEVSESQNYFDNGAVVIRATNKCVVAVLTDLDWPVKSAREPNANLIAAAPTMLNELEIRCAACRRMTCPPPEQCDNCNMKSAIKKAYGEKE